MELLTELHTGIQFEDCMQVHFVLRKCVCRGPTLSSVAAATELAVEAVALDTLERTETEFLCMHMVRQMKKDEYKKSATENSDKTLNILICRRRSLSSHLLS